MAFWFYTPTWKLSSRSFRSRAAAKSALTVAIALTPDTGFGRRGAKAMRKTQGNKGGVISAYGPGDARRRLKLIRDNFRGLGLIGDWGGGGR